jgi:hypothetical protein
MSGEPRDYEVLRERLEAEGFTFDDEAGGVHCNWFWSQLGGTTPDGRPFYYRWKHGGISLHIGSDLDLMDEPDAEEDSDDDPSPDLIIASLYRLIAVGGRDA